MPFNNGDDRRRRLLAMKSGGNASVVEAVVRTSDVRAATAVMVPSKSPSTERSNSRVTSTAPPRSVPVTPRTTPPATASRPALASPSAPAKSAAIAVRRMPLSEGGRGVLAGCQAASLRVNVTTQGGPSPESWRLPQPFLLVGRSELCDLQLTHPEILRRHLYLQIVGTRLFVCDLENHGRLTSTTGTITSGWLPGNSPLSTGPFTISCEPELLPQANAEDDEELLPLSCELEFLNSQGKTPRWKATSDVNLIGQSKSCRLRLGHQTVEQVHCSLIRTPVGVWIIDLASTNGTMVDGRRIRCAPLRDGAELKVGGFCMRVHLHSQAPAVNGHTTNGHSGLGSAVVPASVALSPPLVEKSPGRSSAVKRQSTQTTQSTQPLNATSKTDPPPVSVAPGRVAPVRVVTEEPSLSTHARTDSPALSHPVASSPVTSEVVDSDQNLAGAMTLLSQMTNGGPTPTQSKGTSLSQANVSLSQHAGVSENFVLQLVGSMAEMQQRTLDQFQSAMGQMMGVMQQMHHEHVETTRQLQSQLTKPPLNLPAPEAKSEKPRHSGPRPSEDPRFRNAPPPPEVGPFGPVPVRQPVIDEVCGVDREVWMREKLQVIQNQLEGNPHGITKQLAKLITLGMYKG